jgi:hypothetical protein
VPQGIAELAADMRRYGLVLKDFEGPRYVRLARIRELMSSGALDEDLRLQTTEVAG